MRDGGGGGGNGADGAAATESGGGGGGHGREPFRKLPAGAEPVLSDAEELCLYEARFSRDLAEVLPRCSRGVSEMKSCGLLPFHSDTSRLSQ